MVDILMATYNGERFLSEQIDSIINQTYNDWKLFILDDCSTDDTLKIAEKYAEKYKDKIIVHQNKKNSGSAKNTFFDLLKYSKNNYIMFCDQDDVWNNNKIQITLDKMHEVEKNFNLNIPILIYTDLTVVDEKLNVICNSFYKKMNLNPYRNTLNYILVQNIVTGCSCMMNKKLLEYYTQNHEEILMHDWWIALIAASFGKLVYLNEKTLSYRQHCGNQVGAKDVRSLSFTLNKIKSLLFQKDLSLVNTYIQADCFYSQYYQLLKNKDIFVDNYRQMKKLSKFQKTKKIFKYRYFKYSVRRKIAQIVFC